MESNQSIKAKFEEYIEEKQKDKLIFHKAFMHKSYSVILSYYETNETLEYQKINDEVKHNIVESLAGAIFLIEGYPKTEELLINFILYPDIN